MRLAPFYWNDVSNLSPFTQWLYRACVTLALVCLGVVAIGAIVRLIVEAV